MSSHLLWKAFYEHDVDTFRQLLESTAYVPQRHVSRGGANNFTSTFPGSGSAPGSYLIGSPPANLGTSPVLNLKSRKGNNVHASAGGSASISSSGARVDLNWRDAAGLTLLHRISSLVSEDALDFATALVEHPSIDLRVQDLENGWTALHRAFYFGNVSIARLLLEREAGDVSGKSISHIHPTINLIKIKDREGNGPLDLYAATIRDRTLRHDSSLRPGLASIDSDEDLPTLVRDSRDEDEVVKLAVPFINIKGDQLFTFGSNKNVSLGFGDEDDRQYPERVILRRPEHLVHRFLAEHNDSIVRRWASHDPAYQPNQIVSLEPGTWIDDAPWVVRSRPQHIQDVQMAKLSTAVITSDPESNLYMCGHGKGGRLGIGDEQTRFNFVPVDGGALTGKRVVAVALGQFHTLAITEDGEITSWGNNRFGQLGYSLPRTVHADEDPISTLPRQIFGILKREAVLGIAASRIHSVAHTSTSLYTFGKNEGQLGIVDSDARSLEVQTIPRKVAASLFTASIASVVAIDRATACLLENNDIWLFANYGYLKVVLPLEGFSNYFLQESLSATSYDKVPNRVSKIIGGGDTICALTGRGDIYTLSVKERQESQNSASTTNPAKIRNSVTQPQRVWSPRKANMAAKDVGIDIDGSIILSTEEGSVWKRTKRATLKDAVGVATSEYKAKDFKFSRIPGLTRVLGVRASCHGAYAAIRRDCDVLKKQIVIEEPMLWQHVFSLLPFARMAEQKVAELAETGQLRLWQSTKSMDDIAPLKRAISVSKDIENDLRGLTSDWADSALGYDSFISSSVSDVKIPFHRFLLTGRSKVFRKGFRDLCQASTFTIPDLAVSEIGSDGRLHLNLQGIDILTVVNLVLYLYTDHIVEFWHMARTSPGLAFRYRQIRLELMKIATKLELGKLEAAVRQMIKPAPSLNLDMEMAFTDPTMFLDGDIVVQLEDDEARVHSALARARCPFFEGLFMGRARGKWLAGRDANDEITVDLSHISAATFSMVLRHIYADTGTELFDGVVSIGLDDFLDTVMDVMSAANELMLDRLSQICQAVIGRYVNVRNVCGLLNAIAPSSVNEFKDAGLEYLCLSLEAMLQGRHLNELDEDLLVELDDIVRQNQLAYMPFAKSGRAEALLHERHPELAGLIDRQRQARVDGAALRAKHQQLQSKGFALADENAPSPPPKPRRRSSATPNKPEDSRPQLKPKASSKDMMFAMDEESGIDFASPTPSPAIRPMSSPRGLEPDSMLTSEEVWFDSRGKVLPSPRLDPQTASGGDVTPRTPKAQRSPSMNGRTPSSSGLTWTLAALPGAKSDMRNIMAQAAANRTSSLTQGLVSGHVPASPDTPGKYNLAAPKLSQKERKRLQHAQASPLHTSNSSLLPPEPMSLESSRPANPWQTASAGRIPTMRNMFETGANTSASASPSPSLKSRSSASHLTMRQTVANARTNSEAALQVKPKSPRASGEDLLEVTTRTNTARPSTPRSQGSRTVSSPSASGPMASNSKPIPQSIRHQPPIEMIMGLTMSEILAQQEFEKVTIKEATAKRDLQEIQAEQEFQEWWEKESARVQEAERNTVAMANNTKIKGQRSGRSRRGPKGGGGAHRGDGEPKAKVKPGHSDTSVEKKEQAPNSGKKA